MSLLFLDSCDAGDWTTKYALIGGGDGFSSTTATPFGVGRSILKSPNTNGQITRGFTPSPTVIVGFWFSYNTNYSGFGAGIISLRGDGGITEHLSLATGDAGLTLMLKRGPARDGVILATTAAIAYGWHWCEVKATLHATTGTCEVRVDGVTVVNFTGNTKNGGTSSNIDTIAVVGSGNNTGINIYLKDLFVLNTSGSRLNDFLGPRRVYTVVASGAGASTALTPSTGANWAATEELPTSATDYVTGTPGLKDTYDVTDLPASVVTAEAVQVNVVAKRLDATAVSAKPVLRSAGTDYAPSTWPLGAADTTVCTVFENDPATAAAWTLSGVNAIQHGVEVA